MEAVAQKFICEGMDTSRFLIAGKMPQENLSEKVLEIAEKHFTHKEAAHNYQAIFYSVVENQPAFILLFTLDGLEVRVFGNSSAKVENHLLGIETQQEWSTDMIQFIPWFHIYGVSMNMAYVVQQQGQPITGDEKRIWEITIPSAIGVVKVGMGKRENALIIKQYVQDYIIAIRKHHPLRTISA